MFFLSLWKKHHKIRRKISEEKLWRKKFQKSNPWKKCAEKISREIIREKNFAEKNSREKIEKKNSQEKISREKIRGNIFAGKNSRKNIRGKILTGKIFQKIFYIKFIHFREK